MSKNISLEQNVTKETVSIADFVVASHCYEFPTEDTMPSGYFWSEITAVEPCVTSRGKKAVDVCYIFENNDNVYYVRQRYPLGSTPLLQLYRALIAAGVPEGSTLDAAVGVEEKVRFLYDYDTGFGSIVKRVPVVYEDEDDAEASTSEGCSNE